MTPRNIRTCLKCGKRSWWNNFACAHRGKAVCHACNVSTKPTPQQERRAAWLEWLSETGAFDEDVLRYPVVDIDTGEVHTPEQDRQAARAGLFPNSTTRCRYCGSEFKSQRGGRRYCSLACSGAARKEARRA